MNVKLINDIVANRRIEIYEQIIDAAKVAGYRMLAVADAFRSGAPAAGDKQLILRHDIDSASPATLQMAKIEETAGARASYYFRWRTADPLVMRKVHELGHEVSLHYETVSSFYLRHPHRIFFGKPDAKTIKKCQILLEKEVRKFEEVLSSIGINEGIKTIAAHGHRINRILDYRNNEIFDDNMRKRFGLNMNEVYEQSLIDTIDEYISDCRISYKGGYRYGVTPEEAIKKNSKRILFLTHPEHWYLTKWGIVKEVLRVTCQ